MRVGIYTALYGQYSTLKEFDRRGYDCLCYTDCPRQSSTWSIVATSTRLSTRPRLDGKAPKMWNPAAPHYDATIYIDSTILVTDVNRLVAECLAALEGHQIAFFAHPERTTIGAEALVSVTMPKYAGQNIAGQADHYKNCGFKDDVGLYAGGVIARRGEMEEFGALWSDELRWSLQDQISLPFVLWKLGIAPGVIRGSVYGSEFHKHFWEGPNR